MWTRPEKAAALFLSPPCASRPKSDILTHEAFYHLRGVSHPMLTPSTAHCVSWLHSCIRSLMLEDRSPISSACTQQVLRRCCLDEGMKKWMGESEPLAWWDRGSRSVLTSPGQGQEYLALHLERCWGCWPLFSCGRFETKRKGWP